jgi:hypothetical protein
MTIQPTVIDLNLLGGMNERIDARRGVVPTLLKNCRYTKTGSLSKRPGSASYAHLNARINASDAPTSSPPTPEWLAVTNDGAELFQLGAGHLDSVVMMLGDHLSPYKDRIYRGRTPEATIRKKRSIGNAAGAGDCQYYANASTAASNCFVQAYPVIVDASGTVSIFVDIVDAMTFSATAARLLVASGTTVSQNCKVVLTVAGSGAAYIVYVQGTSIKYRKLDLELHTLGTAVTVAAVDSATTIFDAVSDGVSLFTASSVSSGAKIRMAITNVGTGSTTTADINVNQVLGLGIEATGGEALYLGYYDWNSGSGSGHIYGSRLDLVTLAVSSGPWTILSGTGNPSIADVFPVRASSTERVFVFCDNIRNTIGWDRRDSSGTAKFSTAFSGTRRVFGPEQNGSSVNVAGMGARPFQINGRFYAVALLVPAVGNESWASSYALVDLYADDDNAQVVTGRMMCHAFPLQTNRQYIGRPTVAVNGTTAYLQGIIGTARNGWRSDLSLNEVDFGFVHGSSATANGVTVLGGGIPQVFDGVQSVECGFAEAPNLVLSSQTTGGSLSQNGTYGYIAFYSWKDSRGNIHRGPISNTLSVTLTGTNTQIILTASCLNATMRKQQLTSQQSTPVYIEVYRTVAGASIYYQQGQYVTTVGGAPVSVSDTTADTGIASNQIAYTDGSDGSVLESQMPPAAAFVFRALDRIWLVDTDDGAAWFSDVIAAGEAPRFNSTLTIPAPRAGRYVAGSYIDQNVVLFTQDAIDVVYGDGPDSTGSGSFSQRIRLPFDVGCMNGKSVVSTPYGIFFQSRDGLCLLDRALNVTRIGKPVEDSIGQTQATPATITSAVNVPDLTEVRFSTAIASTQRVCVFDLLQSASPTDPNALQPVWFTYEWTQPSGGTPTVAGACFWNGLYTWITSDGYVFQDSKSTFLDTMTGQTSQWVTQVVDLSVWHTGKVNEMLSFVAATMYAETRTKHDVTMKVYLNFASTVAKTSTWTDSEVAALPAEQLQLVLSQQPVYAARIRIEDAAPTSGVGVTTGEGMRLAAVTAEAAVQGGVWRLPAAARK